MPLHAPVLTSALADAHLLAARAREEKTSRVPMFSLAVFTSHALG